MNLLPPFTLLKKTFLLSIVATLVFVQALSAATITQNINLSEITRDTEYPITLSVGDSFDIEFNYLSHPYKVSGASAAPILEEAALNFDTPPENHILSLATQKSYSCFQVFSAEPAVYSTSYSYLFTAKSLGATAASFTVHHDPFSTFTIRFTVTVTE